MTPHPRAAHLAAIAPARRAALEAAQVRRNLQRQAHVQAEAEARAVAAGVAETVALEEGRGAAFLRPEVRRGERAKPVVRLDGLTWLASRGRLSPRQVQAGTRYGRLAQIIEGGDIASCLALFEVRGTGPRISPTDAKVWARAKLAEARDAVGGHPALLFALDQICALGKRPREVTKDQRASERLEDRLGLGLDLLVNAWGL
jgi:hypothetical protein